MIQGDVLDSPCERSCISVLTRATDALRELEEDLPRRPFAVGDDSADVAERIRAVRRPLFGADAE